MVPIWLVGNIGNHVLIDRLCGYADDIVFMLNTEMNQECWGVGDKNVSYTSATCEKKLMMVSNYEFFQMTYESEPH